MLMRILIPCVILLLGLTLSGTTFYLLRKQEINENNRYIDAQCLRKRILINDEVRGGTTILEALGNVVTMCTSTNETWSLYAENLIGKTSWNIVGSAILQEMTRDELLNYIRTNNVNATERGPNGSRGPISFDREKYLLIIQDYPDRASIGFDYYSDDQRRALVETASKTGELSLSNPAPSINGSVPTVVFFLPTFDAQTRKFRGGVSAGYYMNRMIPQREANDDVYLQMYVNNILAYKQDGFQQEFSSNRQNMRLADQNAFIQCSRRVVHKSTPIIILCVSSSCVVALAGLVFWIRKLLRDRRKTLITQMIAAENIRLANVSERIATEAAKSKSYFFASMSHELRTPLNGIMWMINFLCETDLTMEQRDYARNLQATSSQLLVIVNDVLDFSKIEAGKLKIENITFDVAEQINQLRISYHSLATVNSNHFCDVVNLPSSVCYIKGDPTRLRQILDNLVNNAMKFTKDGTITLNLSIAGESLKFSVSDVGIGMSEAQMATLFLPYAQADNSTARRYGGTGLGLTISKRLVEMMGGKIWCESQLGVGSTFTFTIPYQPVNDPVHKQEQDDGMIILLQAHIVVADDNIINQRIASKILRDAGMKVTVVDNGQKVIDLLKTRNDITCILMDGWMPVMDGYQATKIIRSQGFAEIRIIACTANAMFGERERCLKMGMNGFVSKPIVKENLLAEIKRVLSQD